MKSMLFKYIKGHTYKEYLMFAEAWLLLAFARILIFFFPFKKILPFLGCSISSEQAEKESSAVTASVNLLRMVNFAVLRAAKRSPWRTKCFEQALAAMFMLRFRHIKGVIFFGVKKIKVDPDKDKEMIAHAWLVCSGYSVTGGKNNESLFTVVGRFC